MIEKIIPNLKWIEAWNYHKWTETVTSSINSIANNSELNNFIINRNVILTSHPVWTCNWAKRSKHDYIRYDSVYYWNSNISFGSRYTRCRNMVDWYKITFKNWTDTTINLKTLNQTLVQ